LGKWISGVFTNTEELKLHLPHKLVYGYGLAFRRNSLIFQINKLGPTLGITVSCLDPKMRFQILLRCRWQKGLHTVLYLVFEYLIMEHLIDSDKIRLHCNITSRLPRASEHRRREIAIIYLIYKQFYKVPEIYEAVQYHLPEKIFWME